MATRYRLYRVMLSYTPTAEKPKMLHTCGIGPVQMLRKWIEKCQSSPRRNVFFSIFCAEFSHESFGIFSTSFVHNEAVKASLFKTYCFTSFNWIMIRKRQQSTSIVQMVVKLCREQQLLDDNNIELNNQPRSGRQREIDREAVTDSIDPDPTLTTRDLSDGFDYDHTTIWRALKASSWKWGEGHLVPRLLTEARKRQSQNCASSLESVNFWTILLLLIVAQVAKSFGGTQGILIDSEGDQIQLDLNSI